MSVARWASEVAMQTARTSLQPGGFTLIEIMVVVVMMGLIATMAIPSIYQMTKKEGMRRAVSSWAGARTRRTARAGPGTNPAPGR